MKAIVQERYGTQDDLELRDVATPTIGPGQVLVRVHAASLHPDVWHMISGQPYVLRIMGGGFSRPRNPIPGSDMAGVVESVGEGVTRFRPGDAVFGETIPSHQWTNGGAFAEFVAVREEWLALKPDNVTFEQAASVPTSGFITLLNFRAASRLRPGQKVLINGAGGGVGSLALQLAKAHGARVTAVDCTSKLDFLRTLGADDIVDYTKEDFTRRGERYNFIFDVPGDRPFSEIRRALEPDGRYVPIGHDQYGAAGRRIFGLLPHFFRLLFLSRFSKQLRGPRLPRFTRWEAMTMLNKLLASGKITPVVDSTYPLSQIREAIRHMVDDAPRGKVIVTPMEAL
jgi:NADPH:quinone reductase-like Zn-dependent oxidoreductase